jgi:uncharacterized membrane protein
MGEYTVKEKKVGRGMAYMLLVTGSSHLIVPQAFDQLVPDFLPSDPRLWTYLSGVAELVVALLLLSPLGKEFAGKALRLWGAYLALALFIAVYPANINMAVEWSSRDMPEPLFAYLRLPLQFGLFYWAWALVKEFRKITSPKK